MATVSMKGSTFETVGELPETGSKAPAFNLVQGDMSELTSEALAGKRFILNIFPSIDTPTCANSVRAFNKKAAALDNTEVVCVSADLPFALTRFCGAEGIDNVKVASSFRSGFGQDYGVTFKDGPLHGLLSRAVVVVDESGKVLHTEQVPELGDEPNYDAALAALG
ncbi:MAG: thiol peroxidase [Pseudomonadota bacterium]|nr:lipid hydroperoxide peroxidase [Pseudomonadales bacterium]MDY6921210.1 thiol peroxidase [Pseudomonadota bacterium]